jgi:predicted nucleic acid-binding protein
VNYLLDVNALIAWAHSNSLENGIFHSWAAKVGYDKLATCAHSELGFIRISMLPRFGVSRAAAEAMLAGIKKDIGGFVSTAPSPKLAAWAHTSAHTSDAYLVQLATSAGLTLATFDRGIPSPVERIG